MLAPPFAERWPPPAPRVIPILAVRKVPPLPGVVTRKVPPLMFILDPAPATMAPDETYESVAPLLMLMFVTVSAAPVKSTIPSSLVTNPAVIAEGIFTVYSPVASVPAAKTAASAVPEAQTDSVPAPPAKSEFQLATPVLQVPPGAAPPEPPVVPLISQYFTAAWANVAERETQMMELARRIMLFIEPGMFIENCGCWDSQ